ncbi:MAG: hypothetical protein WAM82_24195 [Thermoanaerobaculia bacterium]
MILASTDGGTTWRQLSLTLPFPFAVAPGDSRVVYAWENLNGGGKLKQSRDGGSTWEVVQERPPNRGSFFSLAVDARDPETIYLSNSGQILRSHDGGRTLEVLDSSFGNALLITDRTRPGLLFGQEVGGGMFVMPVE